MSAAPTRMVLTGTTGLEGLEGELPQPLAAAHTTTNADAQSLRLLINSMIAGNGWVTRCRIAHPMSLTEGGVGQRLVLSPTEGLLAGGPAEQFEARVQRLLRDGHKHLLVDLRSVPRIDSAGVRALVRGYTTAQRMGASFSLVGPTDHVLSVLHVARLDAIFTIYESVADARRREVPWDRVLVVLAGAGLCGALVWAGFRWPPAIEPTGGVSELTGGAGASGVAAHRPFLELLKLVAAALVGMLVTAFHTPGPQDKPLGRSMQQAQILLCVSGAMMMIIIGSSLARAFGIAGAASIIRFRTPVEDPKDVTILFLLMALGMACGLGAFAVAGLGAAFLCAFLVFLDRLSDRRPRALSVEIVSEAREFPMDHVQSVFARNRVRFEPREVSQGKETVVKYHTLVDQDVPLEDLSSQLMGDGTSGVKSVSWEVSKKGF
jgi:anti-anti-sigma factor